MIPVCRCSYDGRDASRRCRDDRGPRRQRFEHDVGQAIDVPAVVPHRRNRDHVGGGQPVRDFVLREIAEETHAIADPRGFHTTAQLGLEIARPRDRSLHVHLLWHRGERVDQILESLLANQSACREEQRSVRGNAEARASPRANKRVWTEAIRVHPVGHDVDTVRVRAECDGPLPEVLTAGSHGARSREHHACGATRRPERLRDVDIGPVEADDQRQPRRRGCGHDAPRHHPVSVHDRRATRPCHGPRRPPPGRERQRCGHVCRPFQADVGLQRRRVPEDVEARVRRVPVEMEVDAVLFGVSRHERMPGRHDMHFMPARGDRRRNRLHERADAVPVEPRVGARHHHDDVACHGALRKSSRQGVISDSRSTELDTFDWP